MKSYKEFREEVQNVIDNRPSYIRMGQAVFNYIDESYGVARTLQFELGIDCFYRDDLIEEFVQKSYEILRDVNQTMKITKQDYIKANKIAARNEEIRQGFVPVHKVHRNKKAYTRKNYRVEL